MDQYVVFGNPIGHSKSPLIHRLFAEQTGQDLEYATLLAPLDEFSDCARGFFKQGSGGNVTVPFKEESLPPVRQPDPTCPARRRSEHAEQAG